LIDDDAPRGRVLTRREVIALLGIAGAGWVAGCSPAAGPGNGGASRGASPAPGRTAAGPCVVRPEQIEGPYFVEDMMRRADLRADADGALVAGAPLELEVAVSRLDGGGCAPLAGAIVDVWHCDALGVYSGVDDPGFDTRGRTFLRGWLPTDDTGVARFTTVYPGWYPGRCVHVHFKLRSAPAATRGFEFVSQLYFDDALTDQVHARPPYAARGTGRVRNARDGIFRDGGAELTLDVRPRGAGWAARFDVALDLS
jgi:protocatechuate 3,4-dioxygenase beta subunit